MKVISSIIEEVIEIVDAQGNDLKLIPFKVNLTRAGSAIQQKRIELANASDDIEKAGIAFCNLLEVVFGKDALNELVDYYGDDYTSMVTDIAPILTDVIFPALDAQREKLVESRKRAKR